MSTSPDEEMSDVGSSSESNGGVPLPGSAPSPTPAPPSSQSHDPALILGFDVTAGVPSPLNPKVPWHEYNPLLRRPDISLQDLNNRGYLNLDNIVRDQGFGYKQNRAVPGAWWREMEDGVKVPSSREKLNEQRAVSEDHWIHPVFHANRWKGNQIKSLPAGWWNNLKPVLQLATLLLEEQVHSGFLIGLMDRKNHQPIDNPEAERRHGKKLYWFQARANSSERAKDRLWRLLSQLTDKVCWMEAIHENKDSERGHGATRALRDISGVTKEGHFAAIRIHPTYLDVLCRGTPARSISIDWTPGTDEESVRLRMQWMLATILVHELMHAMWIVWHGTKVGEPYYRDTRVAELGWQWESNLFSGTIVPGIDGPAGANYGFQFFRWPDINDSTKIKPLTSYKKWGGSVFQNRYAVDMEFVQGFFTHDFWDRVERFGLATFEPEHRFGVRVKWPEPQLWPGESSTAPAFVEGPDPPSPERADEHGIIDIP